MSESDNVSVELFFSLDNLPELPLTQTMFELPLTQTMSKLQFFVRITQDRM